MRKIGSTEKKSANAEKSAKSPSLMKMGSAANNKTKKKSYESKILERLLHIKTIMITLCFMIFQIKGQKNSVYREFKQGEKGSVINDLKWDYQMLVVE